jgi:hypothetical protein
MRERFATECGICARSVCDVIVDRSYIATGSYREAGSVSIQDCIPTR